MRFGKLVQLVVGFAAFMLLSTNALAADAGSVTNTQKLPDSVSTVSQQIDQNSQSSVIAPGEDTDDSNDGTGGASGLSNAAIAPVEGTDTTADVTGSSSDSTVTTSQTITTTTKEKTVIASPASISDGGASSSGSAAISSNGVDQAIPQQSVPAITSESTPAVATINTQVGDTLPASSSVVYRSALLTIQPTIINNDTDVSDLASSIPSAAVPSKVPSPAKSNGGLDQLSLVLAGTVVPPSFLPAVMPVDRLKLLLSLVTLAVLLVNLIVLSYGVWLRKGGFATAARSDSSASYLISSFATPFLLGYVSAPPRMHSPSLMVSDYKTRKTLFAMLSERRKSI
jgi:hypothetical protein